MAFCLFDNDPMLQGYRSFQIEHISCTNPMGSEKHNHRQVSTKRIYAISNKLEMSNESAQRTDAAPIATPAGPNGPWQHGYHWHRRTTQWCWNILENVFQNFASLNLVSIWCWFCYELSQVLRLEQMVLECQAIVFAMGTIVLQPANQHNLLWSISQSKNLQKTWKRQEITAATRRVSVIAQAQQASSQVSSNLWMHGARGFIHKVEALDTNRFSRVNLAWGCERYIPQMYKQAHPSITKHACQLMLYGNDNWWATICNVIVVETIMHTLHIFEISLPRP